jgi:hypothetical protein
MTAFERSFQGLSNDMQGLGLKTAQMFVLFRQSRNRGLRPLFEYGPKLNDTYQGLYTITQVNENGTVQMMIKNVEETINIRWLTPYSFREAAARKLLCLQ